MHLESFYHYFAPDMSDISINYLVTSPWAKSPTINAEEYHPAAIVTSENAPISPNIILATLALTRPHVQLQVLV